MAILRADDVCFVVDDVVVGRVVVVLEVVARAFVVGWRTHVVARVLSSCVTRWRDQTSWVVCYYYCARVLDYFCFRRQ